jgi:hypothetical protein
MGKLDIHVWKRETRPLTLTLYRNHSRWIKGLNVRPENLKLLEESIEKHFKIKVWALFFCTGLW